MEEKKVTIYSTSSCHFCHKAKEYFNANNIKFEEINVSLAPERIHEIQDVSGQLGVPVILINGELVIGFNKKRIDTLLGLGTV